MAQDNVVVGVVNHTLSGAQSHHQEKRVSVRAVLKAMRERVASFPGGCVTCEQNRLDVFNQNKFARNQIDKLVFGFVPMSVRGPRPRRQAFQMNPELRESCSITE